MKLTENQLIKLIEEELLKVLKEEASSDQDSLPNPFPGVDEDPPFSGCHPACKAMLAVQRLNGPGLEMDLIGDVFEIFDTSDELNQYTSKIERLWTQAYLRAQRAYRDVPMEDRDGSAAETKRLALRLAKAGVVRIVTQLADEFECYDDYGLPIAACMPEDHCPDTDNPNCPDYDPDVPTPEPKPDEEVQPAKHQGYVWLERSQATKTAAKDGTIVMMKYKELYELPFFIIHAARQFLGAAEMKKLIPSPIEFHFDQVWGDYPYRGRRTGNARMARTRARNLDGTRPEMMDIDGYQVWFGKIELFNILASKIFKGVDPKEAQRSFAQLFSVPEEESLRLIIAQKYKDPTIAHKKASRFLRWWNDIKQEEGPEWNRTDYGM